MLLHDTQNEIELDGFVLDNSDGTYTASYFPTCLANYRVSVYLLSPRTEEREEDTRVSYSEEEQDRVSHISGSPFVLHPLKHERNTHMEQYKPLAKVLLFS